MNENQKLGKSGKSFYPKLENSCEWDDLQNEMNKYGFYASST